MRVPPAPTRGAPPPGATAGAGCAPEVSRQESCSAPLLVLWDPYPGREAQPLLTGAGIPLCGYNTDEKNLEANFSKLIHEDSEMFEGLCYLICCRSPKGLVQDQGWEGFW